MAMTSKTMEIVVAAQHTTQHISSGAIIVRDFNYTLQTLIVCISDCDCN